MAKLYFYYSAMNAGKSTTLLQSAHNYQEQGMRALLFTPQLDDRYEIGQITSRIGLKQEALGFDNDDDLYLRIRKDHREEKLSCILVDEAQFLQNGRVPMDQLYDLVPSHPPGQRVAYHPMTSWLLLAEIVQRTTGKNLREHLRIGARMLEALELQLTRAEETIRRERKKSRYHPE